MKPTSFKMKWRFVVGIVMAIHLGLLLPQYAWAQCPNDNISLGGSSISCGSGLYPLTTCIQGGEYMNISVSAGNAYVFSTCGDDDFDTKITLYNDNDGSLLGYNDDHCGEQSQVYWEAGFDGFIRVLVDDGNCGDNSSCMTLMGICFALEPCANIINLTCETPVTSGHYGTGIWQPQCSLSPAFGTEVVYSFTASVSGDHTLVVNSAEQFVQYFYKAASEGCNGTGWTCITDTGNPTSVGFGPLTAGTTYYILLDAENPNYEASYHNFQINCSAPPDPCLNGITTLSCETPSTHTMVGLGSWSNQACGFNTPGKERLYSFTPTTTGLYSLQVTAASGGFIDYSYKAASAGCSATGWTCIDDINVPGTYPIGTLTAGTEYYILADPEGSGSKTQTFQIVCPVTPPLNDDCTEATALTPSATCQSITGTTVNATQSTPATCGATGAADDDVWFSFVATSPYHTVVVDGNGQFDPVVDVRLNACNNGPMLTCSNGTGAGGIETLPLGSLTIGATYYVRIYSNGTTANEQGDFSVCVTTQNDPCSPLATLSSGTPITQTLSGSGVWNIFLCGYNTPSQEEVYRFTPATTGEYSLQVTSASGTGWINYMYKPASSGCFVTGGWTCFGHTNSPTTFPTVTLTAGTEYYIMADGENIAASTQTFQINTPEVPVSLTCPNSFTSAACGTQAQIDTVFAVWLSVASGTGGCNGVLTNNNTGAPPACGGTTTVIFTYISECAPFTTTCQATFTVTDAPQAFLNCPQNRTVAACPSQQEFSQIFTTWLQTASAGGGCHGAIDFELSDGLPYCGGATTLTLIYTSSCSPTLTCEATITVEEPTEPIVVNCPQDITVEACNLGILSTYITWTQSATVSGGCGGGTAVPSASPIDFSFICGGSKTVTFSYAKFGCPPLSPPVTCQATFTVEEAPPVVLTCPQNTTTEACQTQDAVDTAFTAWLETTSGSGGCYGVLSNNSVALGGAPPACGGSVTVIFAYKSFCDPDTATCEATFTVPAAQNVALTCPVNTTTAACQTQNAVNAAFTAWLATASASGGCNGVFSNNSTVAPPACGGSTTVTFTYTSSCSPTPTTCQATFTVSAAPNVVLNCPTNTTAAACQTQAAVNTAFATWLATASGTGGCNGVLTNNNTGAPSACGGTTTVTFTYTSSCAPTTTTCQATFTVMSAPTVVLTCPVNTTASACLTQAALDAQYNAWLATASASGGCGGALTNNSPGAPSICSATAVVRTVVFIYTSSCAPFTTTCTATFTVPAYPNFMLPANGAATVACPALATQPAPPTVVDACGKTLTPTGPTITSAPSPVSCEGTRTYAWTYTDCSGHVNTWSYVYTIEREPFTVPANGASQVACPALITQPTPPIVLSNCGEVLTPTGPVILNNPNPITCEGTRTFTFTYTDCEGNTAQWSHVTTVERQPFAIATPNGNATVACPDQTDATPTPPIVTSNCGEVLIPVISISAKPGCEGDRAYIFHYTDCEGNTADWQFTYHVVYQNFMVPANEVVTANCPLQAVQPLPPTILDNCGKPVNMSGPVVSHTQNANSCEASRKYEWTFQDCAGHLRTWSKTFHFEYDADFFVYPDQTDYVSCLSYAQPPIPPTIYDFCGNEIVVTGPVVEELIENGCTGWRKFTFTYTDCGGNSHPWVFTTFANDDQPPLGDCVSGTVDETNLSCIEEVPCPDDFDFGGKVAEMLAAGNIHDECSGNDLVVELDSWSSIWQCTDPDGDGVNTFGRTFYFRIADQCGNEMPSLCSVTYSGVCQPIETFPQDAWGVMGGEPGTGALGNATTDLQVITDLLGQGPLFIGGSHRSISLTNAQCVVDLLPGIGYPTILANCQQVNCGGCNPAGTIGMKNKLATNAIALTLNLRYNVQYNGLTMNALRAQSLNCIEIDADITTCKENGGCKLLIYETNGTPHEFPYTIGGLLDLANLYLDGNLALAVGNSLVIAAALNLSIENVNTYWHQGSFVASCDTGAGIAQPIVQVEKALPKQNRSLAEMRLVPNPANREVRIELAKLAEKQEVVVEFYNLYGQAVLHREFGKVASVSERIMLDGLGTGVYFVRVKAGDKYYQQKLFITKD